MKEESAIKIVAIFSRKRELKFFRISATRVCFSYTQSFFAMLAGKLEVRSDLALGND